MMLDEERLVEERIRGLRECVTATSSTDTTTGIFPAFGVGYTDEAGNAISGYAIVTRLDDGLAWDLYGFINGKQVSGAEMDTRRGT